MNKPDYTFLLHELTGNKIEVYLDQLKQGHQHPGSYLQKKLVNVNLESLNVHSFLNCLLKTKKPQIFAESQVRGDGTDWNYSELSILGDISVHVPVKIYDNGKHASPLVYENPLQGDLIYVPGALLRSSVEGTPVDFIEITRNGKINIDTYIGLYERRLLPPLLHINKMCQEEGSMAVVTVPGLGCGQFAGRFQGQLGALLEKALLSILKKHSSKLKSVRAVYFDPYNECGNRRYEVEGIAYLVRPLTKGNTNKSQLSHPITLQDKGDDFSNCRLFSIVAWDHVSWPGNDFYIGSRATDDGVKAAATDSMFKMTGIKGKYDSLENKYLPPVRFKYWQDVIKEYQIKLHIDDNLYIYD